MKTFDEFLFSCADELGQARLKSIENLKEGIKPYLDDESQEASDEVKALLTDSQELMSLRFLRVYHQWLSKELLSIPSVSSGSNENLDPPPRVAKTFRRD